MEPRKTSLLPKNMRLLRPVEYAKTSLVLNVFRPMAGLYIHGFECVVLNEWKIGSTAIMALPIIGLLNQLSKAGRRIKPRFYGYWISIMLLKNKLPKADLGYWLFG
jgi:hypothetical protein